MQTRPKTIRSAGCPDVAHYLPDLFGENVTVTRFKEDQAVALVTELGLWGIIRIAEVTDDGLAVLLSGWNYDAETGHSRTCLSG